MAWLALLAASASSVAAQAETTDQAVLAGLAAEAAAACPVPNMAPPDLPVLLVGHAEWLAGLHQRSGVSCTPRPELALRIARAGATIPTQGSASAHLLLAELYRRGIGVAADPAAAREQLRRAWLIGGPAPVANPFATDAERDAYLAGPTTVAFLRPYAARPDLPLARVRLARALLAQRSARARAEALAMLGAADLRELPEARFLWARTALDFPLTRTAAMTELRRLTLQEREAEARALLGASVRAQLAGATGEAQWDAIEVLAVLARTAPEGAGELLRAVTAANGGRPPETLTGPALASIQPRLRAPMSDEDYPASALRGEEVGRVALRGLIDPRGRLIFTEPLGPVASTALVGTVRRIYAARPLPPVELGAARTTPYMWVELPGVVFEIRE